MEISIQILVTSSLLSIVSQYASGEKSFQTIPKRDQYQQRGWTSDETSAANKGQSQGQQQKRGLLEGLEPAEILHAPPLPPFSSIPPTQVISSTVPTSTHYDLFSSTTPVSIPIEKSSPYHEVIIKPTNLPPLSPHITPVGTPLPVVSHAPIHLESPHIPPPHVAITKEVPVPYYIHVEKKIPYPVYLKVVQPYPVPVEKHIPYEVKVPVDRPVPVPVHVPVPKPYPVAVEKHVPYPVEKPVPYPVKVLVDRPYPVHVPVEKPVPYAVEKQVHVPVPVHVPVDRPVYIPRPYPVTVEKRVRVPYPVERRVPYPVKVPVEVPVKVPYPVEVKVPVPYAVEKHIPYQYPVEVHKPHATLYKNFQYASAYEVPAYSVHHRGHPVSEPYADCL